MGGSSMRIVQNSVLPNNEYLISIFTWLQNKVFLFKTSTTTPIGGSDVKGTCECQDCIQECHSWESPKLALIPRAFLFFDSSYTKKNKNT